MLKELNEEPSAWVHSDSTAGISAQSRLGLGKMKHVEVRCLFVQGVLGRNRMTLNKMIATRETHGEMSESTPE